MKLIETKNAVGHVLCHDLTRIVPGEFKGAQFRKGHIVTEDDIPMLLSMGKEHLYVWEMEPGMLHENDAAERLCRICKNDNMTRSGVKEGKIELKAACDGLFRVNVKKLNAINMIDELMIARAIPIRPSIRATRSAARASFRSSSKKKSSTRPTALRAARRSWSCCRTSSKPPPSSRPAARSPAAAFRIRSPRSLKRSSGSTASP